MLLHIKSKSFSLLLKTTKKIKKILLSYKIRTRCLRDVSQINQSTNIFGLNLKTIIGISPTAFHKLAHPDGEIASAKAAGVLGTIFILSSFSTTSIEKVAEEAPDTIKFFQVYVHKNRELTKSLIQRAENNGFKGIVVTIDTPINNVTQSNFTSLPHGYKLENFKSDENPNDFDPTVTWDDIKWIVELTKLPVILKGILTKEDAILAITTGCKGIIVSNHGGRLLDEVPATIQVLPEIVNAVSDQITVMIDGGIRSGFDVFKAMALGAKMVFVGRPIIYGLCVDGQEGVKNVLNILKDELKSTMAFTGCSNIQTIESNMVVHKSYYVK